MTRSKSATQEYSMKHLIPIFCLSLFLPSTAAAGGRDHSGKPHLSRQYVEIHFEAADFDRKAHPELGHQVAEPARDRMKTYLNYVGQFARDGYFKDWSTEKDKAAGYGPELLEYRAKSISSLLKKNVGPRDPDKPLSKKEQKADMVRAGAWYVYEQFKGIHRGGLITKSNLEIGGLPVWFPQPEELQPGMYLVHFHLAGVNKKAEGMTVELGAKLKPIEKKDDYYAITDDGFNMGEHAVTGTLEKIQIVSVPLVISPGQQFSKVSVHLHGDNKPKGNWPRQPYCIVEKVEIIGPVKIPVAVAQRLAAAETKRLKELEIAVAAWKAGSPAPKNFKAKMRRLSEKNKGRSPSAVKNKRIKPVKSGNHQ
jgi:hypothetical protein